MAAAANQRRLARGLRYPNTQVGGRAVHPSPQPDLGGDASPKVALDRLLVASAGSSRKASSRTEEVRRGREKIEEDGGEEEEIGDKEKKMKEEREMKKREMKKR